MAKLDAYLVEKLREILHRLNSKDIGRDGGGEGEGLTSKHFDLESTDSQQQEQQLAYKRSPSLFPYAPAGGQDDMQQLKTVSDLGTSSLSAVDTSITRENGYIDSVDGLGEETTQNYYETPIQGVNSSLSFSSNFSDPITYGVEVNRTTIGRYDEEGVGERLSEELGKINNEDESTALTRNLHEFIHILKMSLKSGTSTFSTGGELQGNVFNENHFGVDGAGGRDGTLRMNPSGNYGNDMAASGGGRGGVDPFSGIQMGSTAGMDFNLTLDDITDLNNLLEGDDSTFGIPLKHILIIVTYMLIACVSIIGNLLVVQLVIRSRRFHTLTHALLSNLAVADLLLATLNIPFSAARVIMTEWPFGSILCRTVPFVQVTSVYATSFTMAVIAMDRYQVIMNPLGKRLKCSQGVLLVIAIWIVSATLSLPYALNHQVVTVLTVRIVKRCQAEFGSLRARQTLTVATFLAQYLLPLLFTTASYIAIMKRLWHRSSGLGSTTPRQVAAQSRAKRKTIKMLVLTVICFAISWAPINFYHLLTHFSHVRHNSTAILICHMIAMSSSMYNPFIFCGLNEHFRREAVKWLHCFRTRRSPIVHPGTEVNGMLARADQTSRRNLSTTVVHTTVSCRRSPQLHDHHHISASSSPRSCQRRRILAASSPITTPAAVYMTPRSGNNSGTSVVERVEVSPVATRFLSGLDASRNGKPELLFLVKDRMSSLNDEPLDPDEIDSGEDVMNGEDFPDSLCEEWNSSGDYKDCKNVTQLLRDQSDIFSPSKETSSGNNGYDVEAATAASDDSDGGKVDTELMGECETSN